MYKLRPAFARERSVRFQRPLIVYVAYFKKGMCIIYACEMAGADIGWASEKQPPICYKYYKYIVSPGRQFYNMCPMLFMYKLLLAYFAGKAHC